MHMFSICPIILSINVNIYFLYRFQCYAGSRYEGKRCEESNGAPITAETLLCNNIIMLFISQAHKLWILLILIILNYHSGYYNIEKSKTQEYQK